MGLDNGPRGDYNNVRSFRMKSYNETGRRRDPYEKRVSSVFAAVQVPVPPDRPVAGPAGQRAVSALHIAEQGDRKNPGRLYSEWSISKQTGHSAVEWLKKRDLVTLEPDPQDRRGKLVVLTPAGIYPDQGGAHHAGGGAGLSAAHAGAAGGADTLIRRTTNYFKEEVEALAVRKETEDDDPTL